MAAKSWTWEELASPEGLIALEAYLGAGGSPHALLELPPTAVALEVPAVGSLLHAAASLGLAGAVRALLALAGPHAALARSSAGDEPLNVPACTALLSLEMLPAGEALHVVPVDRVRPVGLGGFAPPAESAAGRYLAQADAFAQLRTATRVAGPPGQIGLLVGDLCECAIPEPEPGHGRARPQGARWVRARVTAVWQRDDAGVRAALVAARRAALSAERGAAAGGGTQGGSSVGGAEAVWRATWLGDSALQLAIHAAAERAGPSAQAAGAAAAERLASLSLRWASAVLLRGQARELRTARGLAAGSGSLRDTAPLPLPLLRVLPLHQLAEAVAAMRAALDAGAQPRGGRCPPCVPQACELRHRTVPAERMPSAAVLLFVAHRADHAAPAAGPYDLALAEAALACGRALAVAAAAARRGGGSGAAGTVANATTAEAAAEADEGSVFLWLDACCLPPPPPRAQQVGGGSGGVAYGAAQHGAGGRAGPAPHELPLWALALGAADGLALCAPARPPRHGGFSDGFGAAVEQGQWALLEAAAFLAHSPAQGSHAQRGSSAGHTRCAHAGNGAHAGQWQRGAESGAEEVPRCRWLVLPPDRRAGLAAAAYESGTMLSAPRLAPLAASLRLRATAAASARAEHTSASAPGRVGGQPPLPDQQRMELLAAAELLPASPHAHKPRALEAAAALGSWPLDQSRCFARAPPAQLGGDASSRTTGGRDGRTEPAPRVGAAQLGIPAWQPRSSARQQAAVAFAHGTQPRAAGLAAAGPEGLPGFGHGQFAAQRRAVASVEHPHARKWFAQHAPAPRSTMWKPAGRAPLDPAPLRAG